MRDKISFVKGGLEFGLGNPISRFQAQEALLKNVELLDPQKFPAMWNMNVALLYVVDTLDRVRDDVALLHNKIQPILKQISDEEAD